MSTILSSREPACNEHWQRRCAELEEERDRLQREVVKLREHLLQCQEALVTVLTHEEGELDEVALFALAGTGQSAKELIAELEAKYGLATPSQEDPPFYVDGTDAAR